MKSIFHLGLMVLLLFIAFSCKKKTKTVTVEPSAPTETTYPSYSQLKVGNYWIYQRFMVYPKTGVESKVNGQDSCYVMKDTLISNKLFYKLRKFDFPFNKVNYLFLRDSSHCIVNEKGKVLFSSQDFTSIFDDQYLIEHDTKEDTVYHLTSKMDDKDLIATCPAGTFVTSNMKTTYTISANYSTPDLRIRFRNSRYAKNVGQILETEEFMPDWSM
jgi:hypothetical protein